MLLIGTTGEGTAAAVEVACTSVAEPDRFDAGSGDGEDVILGGGVRDIGSAGGFEMTGDGVVPVIGEYLVTAIPMP